MLRCITMGLGALVATLAVTAAGSAGSAGGKTDAPPRWEYRVLSKQQVIQQGKNDLVAGLNELGEQGWELVAVDGGYIFKRRRPGTGASVEDLKRRLADAEGNVEAERERLAWSELMARKGFLSEASIEAERTRMKQVQAAAERARRELDVRLVPVPKKVPEK